MGDVVGLILVAVGLAITLLAAFWKFSHDQGKQTQIIESIAIDLKEMKSDIKDEISTVHTRVDRVESRQTNIEGRQHWMLGKMGIKEGDMGSG